MAKFIADQLHIRVELLPYLLNCCINLLRLLRRRRKNHLSPLLSIPLSILLGLLLKLPLRSLPRTGASWLAFRQRAVPITRATPAPESRGTTPRLPRTPRPPDRTHAGPRV